MPIVTGAKGKVTIHTDVISEGSAPAAVGRITRWTCDFRRDIFPADVFDAGSTSKLKIGGMNEASGTCEGWCQDIGAFNLAASLAKSDLITAAASTIELIVHQNTTTDQSYTFPAIISNINISLEKVGQAKFTLSFESSGNITTAHGS